MVVDGSPVRAIARGPDASRVTLELAPSVRVAPSTRARPTRDRGPVERSVRAPVERVASAPVASGPVERSESSSVVSEPGESAPVVSERGESGPVESVVRAEKPRSFLERVIAGTSGGPAPRLDMLDPSGAPAAESDGAKVKRSVDRLVRASAARGAPRTEPIGPVALDALEDGTFRYKTGGFVATIGRDGSVAFVNLDNKTGLGSSGLPGRDPDDLFEPYGASIDAPSSVDGAARNRVGNEPTMGNAVTLGSGSFDPTAALLRAQGQDPYEHEKLCFLDDTRDLRADLRKAHERAQMGGLRRALEHAWFDDAPAPERRAAIFAIWDECREEEVGLLARALVVSFVRQHLPRGSADAFGAAELEALNARRASTSAFEPYRS